ncbi:hypothetical protein L1887_14873 [Cichorium endivia]|nr:hypothetical protein L1887_14873 [Cichorium endivia]
MIFPQGEYRGIYWGSTTPSRSRCPKYGKMLEWTDCVLSILVQTGVIIMNDSGPQYKNKASVLLDYTLADLMIVDMVVPFSKVLDLGSWVVVEPILLLLHRIYPLLPNNGSVVEEAVGIVVVER